MRRSVVVAVLIVLGLLAGGCKEELDTFTVTVPTDSMAPTFHAGQEVSVTEVADDYEPELGDLVYFEDPGGWLVGGGDEGHLIKRVMGVPGDTIVCCDSAGRISVNGEAIDEASYILPRKTCAGAGVGFGCRWTVGPVPEESVFVLGDNRGASADSRAHMCQPTEDPCSQSPWVPFDSIQGTADPD
ncbi:signal peptidase I [Nocardioides humilatus]|uniref:Signal peptidase I n=1 Tax=Nocardioides humilatus TaxID=2607660 RepID=A0A5B1LND2_9ACTN|nr:signal peptidase I [Nocardioides humilatus]KAA1421618.1 signal peptidase I [Nocardioides humilatus]